MNTKEPIRARARGLTGERTEEGVMGQLVGIEQSESRMVAAALWDGGEVHLRPSVHPEDGAWVVQILDYTLGCNAFYFWVRDEAAGFAAGAFAEMLEGQFS